MTALTPPFAGTTGRAAGLALALVLAAAGALGAEEVEVRRLRAIPADAVSLLLAGRQGGDLDAAIAGETTAAVSSGGLSVDVVVELPGSAIAAENGAAPVIEIFVYALGPGSAVRAHLAERHTLAGGGGATAAGSAGATLRASLSGLSSDDRLRVLVRDAHTSRFALREIAIESPSGQRLASSTVRAGAAGSPVLPGGGGRGGGSASDAADAARRARREAADRERRRGRVKLLARAYEEILHDYASGAGERAVEDLRRFEVDALADPAKNQAELLASLAEAQALVAGRLAQREPDSLAPLLLLHLDTHDRHAESRDLRLASHSRARVSAIAELYASTGISETAARLASDALTAIGSYLQGANQLTSGRKLLARAVELDARNLEARLAIALGHESHGDYAEALRALEPLATSGSFDDEVRLRRATILARLGRLDEAAVLYERLVGASPAAWVVTVAYQELARIHLGRDRPAAAAAALEQATRRFPEDRTLLLQLAYALERAGRRDRARQSMEVLDGEPTESRASRADLAPRARYQRGLDLVGRRSELLARSGRALLPTLADTLESIVGGSRAGAA